MLYIVRMQILNLRGNGHTDICVFNVKHEEMYIYRSAPRSLDRVLTAL
jgi:hypothetical protein